MWTKLMEFFQIIWNPIWLFISSALRIAQVGTPFSYLMWFLLLLLAVGVIAIIVITRLYMIPFIPFILLGKMSEWFEGMKDDDGDGIRNRKDKDRNGDGILDILQPLNLFKRRK